MHGRVIPLNDVAREASFPSGSRQLARSEQSALEQFDPVVGAERLLEDEPNSLWAAVLAEDVATLRTLPGGRLEESSNDSPTTKALATHHGCSTFHSREPFNHQARFRF